MGYSIDAADDRCYPGSSVLVNKLDFSAVDSDTMMLATIHASSGIMDTLLQVFDSIITVSQ